MSLKYKHISQAIEQATKYLNGRRDGTITSLKTGSKKLNNATMDGLEWNKIITLGGLSGSGKSLVCEQWKREFIENNPDDFKILSFEFEMLAVDQILRNLSAKTAYSVKDLQIKGKDITQQEFDAIIKLAHTFKYFPIYYVDNSGTVDDIESTIYDFYQEECRQDDLGLVVTLDHVLLTMGKQGESEKAIIDSLYKRCIKIKKHFESLGHRIIFVLVSQLNRDIETPERSLNPALHYPTKNDLFGASSIYHTSDYVIITHKPVNINGIGNYYGLPVEGFPKGLPTMNPKSPQQPMIYWHIIKARGDDISTLMMVDNFKESRIDEY